eukprot:285638_1
MSQQSLPDGYAFYKKIGSPKFICAPMVQQSELPFRLLCRSYNIPLCYSPMINSKHYLEHPKYAECAFQTCIEDRPLIAQFCANDPNLLLLATKSIEHKVDAIDINFGCPQNIAKRGNYGAFLLKDIDTMCALVNKLYLNLSIPICAKIRIVENEEKTLEICKRLRLNGISILTVHGRTLNSKKNKTGKCNFKLISKIKQIMDIPVFANGGCENINDVINCLKITGCDGYMAAESILSNPSMFITENKSNLKPFKIANDYINYCKLCKYKKNWIIRNKYVAIKGHLFKILYRELTIFQEIRNKLGGCDDIEYIWNVVNLLEKRKKNMNKFIYEFIYNKITINWYHRHWKSYKQLELMDLWDIVLNECNKPIENNQFELIELMIKYNILNYKQCKHELMMSNQEINNLKICIKIQREKEEIEKNNKQKMDTEANLINSMFGMHQDSDDDDDDDDDIIDIS